MSSNDPKSFDVTTEEGLLRAILYKAKNVNPGAIERFIEAYDLNKKHFTANPAALQSLMQHTFGPAYGSDAFQMFMSSRGQYVADAAPTPGYQNGGGGMNPMLMMMMLSGGNMSQMLPLLMQNPQAMSGGGAMGDMMNMMMMSEFKKQNEKKEQQEQFDRIMNVMMLKMIGGTMDSRTQMDAASGNFMVNEILDKNNNVTKRELVPMATILSNPLMAGGIFGKSGTDETTQLVLKNALDEKSKAYELMMQQNQPLNQILMTMISNFQSKNDPIAQFSQLMDMKDKFIGSGAPQIDPEIEKMKIDLQLAMRQQDFTLEQMKHNWEVEKEEKKAGAENVKSWMSMIGQVGEKLAAPAMSMIAGGMGRGGMLPGGGQPGPGGLPPLGAQPVKPGGITTPPSQPQPQPRQEGIPFGTPDPDHNQHLLPPDQMQRQGEQMDPQLMMMIAKQQEQANALQAAMSEIHRLRSIIVSENGQQQHQHQPYPEVDKKNLENMSTEKIKEILEDLRNSENNTERERMLLENELSDREWLDSPPPEVEEYDRQEAQKIADRQDEDEDEPSESELAAMTDQERVDELPVDEPEPESEEEPTS